MIQPRVAAEQLCCFSNGIVEFGGGAWLVLGDGLSRLGKFAACVAGKYGRAGHTLERCASATAAVTST